ncbi:aminomethyl-transferring glycine dehydrogenase subunit GcvPA [Ruminococcaceae bacterium OttesenSCG-928-I18]|nr:aminomethyl-transferring glycine dehydrogenase subunit GcvPA [Ruminococcaceae bacterium OttesenSCG-928-I18]
MGGYIPMARCEQEEMLAELGLSKMEDLFTEVPKELLAAPLEMPKGKSEYEVRRIMEDFGRDNKIFKTCFRGAGAYRHYAPAIAKHVSAKETFLTAYTPYQAEISQGGLQAIFEFQTDICVLTGMDISNASVYDGATAAAEAIVMCRERKREKALIYSNCNPDTLSVAETYCKCQDIPYEILPAKDGLVDKELLKEKLDETVSCVLVQSPNYYGMFEGVEEVSEIAHAAGAKVIHSGNPIAMAIINSPGEMGADIAVGEAQPLGLSLAYGGPYLGYMACREALMRRLPGRIVGQTVDENGERCFVLTMQAREQHIRREKASSSICSNQALCALAASAYIASMGPEGLRCVAQQCYDKAHYAAQRLEEVGYKRRHQGEFFHEFLTECPPGPEQVLQKLEAEGILGGLAVDGGILWCCTEMNTRAEINRMVAICEEVALI